MLIEHTFKITGKKKINYGLGITTPGQEIYNFLRDSGFYDLDVKVEK